MLISTFIDELGYLALDQHLRPLLSGHLHAPQPEALHDHYNTPFSDWGNILFNTTIATAIADRLVENSEVCRLGSESLRRPKNPNPPAEKS